jgi:hypothetical protein
VRTRGSNFHERELRPRCLAGAKSLYACKIEETTNGRGRGVGSQAGQTVEIVAQRGIARDVQVDEQIRAAQNGEDQAQGKTDALAEEKTLRIRPMLHLLDAGELAWLDPSAVLTFSDFVSSKLIRGR